MAPNERDAWQDPLGTRYATVPMRRIFSTVLLVAALIVGGCRDSADDPTNAISEPENPTLQNDASNVARRDAPPSPTRSNPETLNHEEASSIPEGRPWKDASGSICRAAIT